MKPDPPFIKPILSDPSLLSSFINIKDKGIMTRTKERKLKKERTDGHYVTLVFQSRRDSKDFFFKLIRGSTIPELYKFIHGGEGKSLSM